MIEERFRLLIERMARGGVAGSGELRGCSDREIAMLEGRYGVKLPESYRAYLKTMGHVSGRLFTHDHLAVFYPYVLTMTDELRSERLSGKVSSAEVQAPPGFTLPGDALLIAGRLGAAWEFIRCTGADDSEVFMFSEGNWTIRRTHASVIDWLEAWCRAAEDAIRSGYFRQSPSGTRP